MKAGIRNISIAVVEPQTFLTVELDSDAQLESFCVDMASRNSISGLLPLSMQYINGIDTLHFDITELRSLSAILNPALPANAVISLLRNMVDSLQELPEFFLHSSQCLLELDYIYSTKNGKAGFALVPMKQDPADGSELLKKLFSEILGRCTSRSNQNIYAPLMTCLIRPVFNLTEFSDTLDTMTGKPASKPPHQSTPTPAPTPRVQTPPVRVAPTPSEKPAVSVQQGVQRPQQAAPNLSPQGFAIPGGGGVVIPPEDHPSKKDQKQSKKPLFAFGKKKESASEIYASLLYNGQTIQINKTPFVIGRVDSDLSLNDPRVSLPHATILFENGAYSIRDEGSLNYTFVNQRQVPANTTMLLADGAELKLGPATLIFKA